MCQQSETQPCPSESVGGILSVKQLEARGFLPHILVQCSFSLQVSRQGAGLLSLAKVAAVGKNASSSPKGILNKKLHP